MIFIAAAFVAAGGAIHLSEWLATYRYLPSSVPGAAVVRVGFPINAGLSAVIAIALVITMVAGRQLAPVVIGAAFVFEAASLIALIISRTGALAGWTEPVWTYGANQTRAVEIGALAALTTVAALAARRQRE